MEKKEIVRDLKDEVKGFLGKTLWFIAIVMVITFIAVAIFRIGWVTFVDRHELGFTFNRFSGQIEVCDRTGYIVRTPIKYVVHAIDLRPYQLSITANFGDNTSSGIPARVLNAKLVKFNPTGLQIFVAWHGRDAGDNLTNLKEIMKCYAFDKEDGKDCPFIEVISEINPTQAQTLPLPINKVK